MSVILRWEYRAFEVGFDELEDKLNSVGLRGWELVALTATSDKMPFKAGEGIAYVTVNAYQAVVRKPLGGHPDEEPSPPPSIAEPPKS